MSFANEKTVKAVRKPHRCDGCGSMVAVGESAWRWSGMTDGDFGSAIYHPDCREAEVEHNRIAGTDNADEWCDLTLAIEEDDGAIEWLREKFPAVAARFSTQNKERSR